MKSFSTIRLSAPHDPNGNPRRVYLVLREGDIVAAYDEGYRGEDAITNRHHRAAYNGLTLNVSYAEYAYAIKHHTKQEK